ncbi:MAG TPA: CAP domain-containing protein [Acidimicrobiales bacterium]|nr:CAP domain-containing protein [Acidimicrobiales bacterium]
MLVAGLLVAISALLLPGQAMADQAGDATYSTDLVNASRAAYGVNWLTPDSELQAVAQRQADRMAGSGYIFHSYDLGGQLSWGWSAWAENVGYGPSVDWIHGAFMGSGHHAANILGSSFNYVGVGVAYGYDGSVYVAQVFGRW